MQTSTRRIATRSRPVCPSTIAGDRKVRRAPAPACAAAGRTGRCGAGSRPLGFEALRAPVAPRIGERRYREGGM